MLVVVGALVAVYRSAAGPSAADPGAATEPDLLVLAGPALIGLATGQLALLLLRRGAALAMRRPGRGAGRLGGLGGFLAARRLARLADAAASVRLLVAAAVVAGLGLTATVQTEAWADDTARLELGSAYRLDLGPVDAEDALALTRDLDPDGEHLMAAVVVPDEGRVTGRRVFLDTRRVGVLGDFLAGTPAAEVPALLEEVGDLLRGDGDGQVRGDQLVVQVAGVSARGGGRLRPQVRVDLTDQQGRTRTVEARLRLGADGAPTGTVLPIRCTEGCTLDEVVLARTRGDRDLPFLLSRLSTDTDDLLGGAWTASDGVTAVAGGLLAGTDGRTVTTEPVGSGAGAAQPVVVTRTATWEGDPVLESPGGDDRAARVLARAPALPLVAADGVLADLPRALVGASRTVPAAEVLVLAAADTPAALLAEAAEASGSEPVALEPTRLRVGEETGAAQARVYALMAGFGLLVALLVLVTAVSRERAAWRRDVAALRVAGVDAGSLRRAVRVEVGWLLVCSVAAAVAGAWLAVSLLLADLALVAVPLHAVPLTTAVAPGLLLAVAVGVGLLVAVVVGRGRALASRATRPATLREDLR